MDVCVCFISCVAVEQFKRHLHVEGTSVQTRQIVLWNNFANAW